MNIGARLKAIRKDHGMSQRKLAKHSNVNNGTISLIEQNKISPSVSSLKRLLDVFSMSLSEFFDEDENRTKRFFRADELTEFSSDDIRFLQVGGNLGIRRMQIMREYYPPGADTGEHMLSHQGEEGGIIIRGEVEVTVGSEIGLLRAGDGYYFDSELPHRFRNLGEDECEIISSCTPPTF